ncbi:MAG: hypothetical protein UW73_C0039G0008 [Microgenomates group bacterium GW2011_GWB1_44_8]|nr:MAG: hypothetical protein UW73_C0039G0008 [Microgenomates group bacterium GW2011_GWB1_44_8]
MYDSEGNTSLSVSTLYPKDGERQKDSRKLKELISEIEKYIENIINFVKENGGKTSLALEDSNKTELMRKALGI